MLAQVTMPSKTLNTADKLIYVTDKTNFKQYLSTNPSIQSILEGKFQHKEVNCNPENIRN